MNKNFPIRHLLGGMLLLLLASACQKEEVKMELPPATYVFLSHTRDTEQSNDLIEGVDQVDYNAYDMLWLGGDLVYFSTNSDEKIQELDDVFQLSSPQTLFAPGNHDYTSPARISAVTGRPTFYSHHENGITFLVLDTQIDGNQIADDQLDLFRAVTDTLQQSDFLILLHHHLLWMVDGGELEAQANQVSNGPLRNCGYCLRPQNNFYTDLFPALQQIQAAGTQVICIGGDLGNRIPYFEHRTSDGIVFLGSGMGLKGPAEGEVLVFDHDRNNGTLNWSATLVEKLLQK
ncbi:MAG: metallophosphoesterase family protein [Bacteroidota bacterium]